MNARILVLPGDGIGPEVTAEAMRVLRAVELRFGHAFECESALVGGSAIDATGVALPVATQAAVQEADAVLLGAVGGPQWDDPRAQVRPEQGLLALRRLLGLYANLRPVRVHPALTGASTLRADVVRGVDLLVVRELTGGIYYGEKRREIEGGVEHASDLCRYSATEIARVVRVAAQLARARRGSVISVDKANVLETSRLWRRVATAVLEQEYPDVRFEHMLVDACAMHLIRRPTDFDVIVTENMFGDILTDEASMLAGSMGLLPSASLGDVVPGRPTRPGLYEPIHGSAPDIAGHGVANPLACILSVALLLRYSLSLEHEAAAVESAVSAVIDSGMRPRDLAAPGEPWADTASLGRAVVEALVRNNHEATRDMIGATA